MKRCVLVFLGFMTLIFYSCNNSEESPVTPTQKPRIMLLEDYMTYIDSHYYKVWSDSSWEKFNQAIRIGNIDYVTVINNEGNEYYYSTIGYAGFKAYGEPLILFDTNLPTLPDTLLFNYTYTRETTFYYQGYNYTLIFNETLLDTVSAALPFGIFKPCLWFRAKSTISASGQTETENSEFWLANGPGTIKVEQDNGITIIMVRGVVNGESWGMPLQKISDDISIHKDKITLIDIQRTNQFKFQRR